MNRYWATLEIVNGDRAILALFLNGEWVCGGRIDRPRNGDLYEMAYIRASQVATGKGGILDRFTVTA